ncbi:MAG TPA: ANTAR domain-containing protein [Mycobacteriales bacterium]|nr:ANTAR domain-containing protein [Mycobacteriales bacterium]
MVPASLEHPAVDAVLSTAAALLDMEVVFLGGLTDEHFTFERIHARGAWPGLADGHTVDRTDSMCHRLLSGAACATADAAADPAYRDAPVREQLGVTSYVGVPVRNPAGEVVATLCGIDRAGVEVSEATIEVLRGLADVLSAQLGPLVSERIVIQRAPGGSWQVAGEPTEDLTSAMVLADLLAAELGAPGRPPRGDPPDDELTRLKLSVRQLEHALAARVVVEQAIGVLTERQGGSPRDAFERLRKVARTRGRRVHDLAGEVVASAADHAVPLPPELAGRR